MSCTPLLSFAAADESRGPVSCPELGVLQKRGETATALDCVRGDGLLASNEACLAKVKWRDPSGSCDALPPGDILPAVAPPWIAVALLTQVVALSGLGLVLLPLMDSGYK